MLRPLKRFPATSLILLVVTAASTSVVAQRRAEQAERRATGVSATNNAHPLKKARNLVLLPGIAALFVAGTVSGSISCAYVAFAVAMVMAYVPPALLVDWGARRAIRSRRSPADPQDTSARG
jgi:hypothetical protein